MLARRALLWLGAPVSALGGVFVLWGPWACALAIAQALVGILLLEMVNYIEHYGLVRQRLASGRCACPADFPSCPDWIDSDIAL